LGQDELLWVSLAKRKLDLQIDMEFFSNRIVYMCLLASANLSACASTPTPPEEAVIRAISIEKGIAQETIISGDYSRDFDVPGYRIVFESEREIAPVAKFPKQNPFVNLEYYDCGSSRRYKPEHAYSARDYVWFEYSSATVIEEKPNGSFLYEAQLTESAQSKGNETICAKIFVHDGNIRRKVWQPVFVSNEIKLRIPI